MDSRDAEALYGKDYERFDEKRMVLVYELYNDYEEFEVEFPAKYEVCSLCYGRGKHVNPSIDAHGISREEFSEDPDFAGDYFSGLYDETCYRCCGSRVEPVIDESVLSQEQKNNLELLEEKQTSEAQSRREDEYCRRMGF